MGELKHDRKLKSGAQFRAFVIEDFFLAAWLYRFKSNEGFPAAKLTGYHATGKNLLYHSKL
jgi:hypothetical protein